MVICSIRGTRRNKGRYNRKIIHLGCANPDCDGAIKIETLGSGNQGYIDITGSLSEYENLIRRGERPWRKQKAIITERLPIIDPRQLWGQKIFSEESLKTQIATYLRQNAAALACGSKTRKEGMSNAREDNITIVQYKDCDYFTINVCLQPVASLPSDYEDVQIWQIGGRLEYSLIYSSSTPTISLHHYFGPKNVINRIRTRLERIQTAFQDIIDITRK